MNLDRGLIKSQAKELIRGKVMKLFITVFVIQCIVLIPNIINMAVSADGYEEIFESYGGNYFDSFEDNFDNDFNNYDFEDDDDYNPYEDDFENFGSDNNSGKKDFYNYGTSFTPTSAKAVIDTAPVKAEISSAAASMISVITAIAELLLIPLSVTLMYFFVLFIRGKEFSGIDGLKYIFKESFTNNYGNKIGVALIRELIMIGLCLISWFIFFIPVFIFYYSSYFAYEIMCDNPQLSPWQAIKLSKKMIKGNRTELFVLDLSFIPWALLCVFVFPLIYVIPYVQTTKALYYENFRIRAMQQGRITEDDFLTDLQKMQKYANQNNGAYQPNPNQQQGYAQAGPYTNQYTNAGYYNPPQNNQYSAPQANNAPEQNNVYAPQQSNPYSAPQNTYTAPQQNVYSPAQNNTYTELPSEPVAPPAPTAEETAVPTAEAEKTIQPEAEKAAPAENIKPSEKYTPVTPPSEEYNKTED